MSRKYTNTISETQCIGDSLNTINTNYENLDLGLQGIDSLLTSIPSLMNIRMSLSPTLPILAANSTVSNTLYIHPYNGNVVFLYNTVNNAWELKRLTSVISRPLQGLAANTNYDVYLSYNTTLNKIRELGINTFTYYASGSLSSCDNNYNKVLPFIQYYAIILFIVNEYDKIY
jgi:hypothetical protein